ncbi:exodeoxyribonuclease VII large subunit [Roseateles sp.]|uniref:exodeoxyribonuclease VII large subunit n=1 Tax=Roseateles sp. TaxID=1971397 RepID=UPI00286CAFA7|nr:exodeoxyribonuclease VII large subunit [Roseateles sp.]
MTGTLLKASYQDRSRVKELGARWNPELKTWYVPEGMDLAPFAPWLAGSGTERGLRPGALPQALAFSLDTPRGADLALPGKGMALSALLNGVAQAVALAYAAGVWTRAEVVKADIRKGHVYLELVERNSHGDTLAQARAMIWASVANKILPEFEHATGVVLAAGIKLLVRAKPSASPLYGLNLVIDAIDPDYTLGDLEAKKREIRARLLREGIFEANQRLASPWDYQQVIVVAPAQAAGLGDFQAEAARLERHGLCGFTYVHSRFQGECAADEIRSALAGALHKWNAHHQAQPDAVVLIRGGGAVNDLAWLNDYALARLICELDIPVLTGIGHERDHTILDEVAHICFDTPSKVIAAIEQTIARRAGEAERHFDEIVGVSGRVALQIRQAVDAIDASVKLDAMRHLRGASERSAELMSDLRLRALGTLREASEQAQAGLEALRHQADKVIAGARHEVPAALAEVKSEGRRLLRAAEVEVADQTMTTLQRAAADIRQTNEASERAFAELGRDAQRIVADAQAQSAALLREVSGQGPDKTLGRGFSLVRAADGSTITSAATAAAGAAIQIEFHDGVLLAQAVQSKPREQ